MKHGIENTVPRTFRLVEKESTYEPYRVSKARAIVEIVLLVVFGGVGLLALGYFLGALVWVMGWAVGGPVIATIFFMAFLIYKDPDIEDIEKIGRSIKAFFESTTAIA